MNTRDQDLDTLLRQSFDGPLADGGFSARVMQRVQPRRRGSAWLLPMSVLAGILLCCLSLADSPLWRTALQGWLAGEWTRSTALAVALIALMALMALGWTLAEKDAT